MAVRFDNSADGLSRTAGLISYNSTYTWMAWIYLVTIPTLTGGLYSASRNSAATLEGIRINGSGLIVLQCQGNGAVGSTVLSASTWYHLAMVRNSNTDLTVWLNGASEKTNTTDTTGRSDCTRMEHGAERTADANPYDGRVCAIKIWQAALSGSEIAAEMNDYCPVRISNLWAFYPVFIGTERHKDFSGNGRDWTEDGTLTNEADKPSLSWNCLPPVPDRVRKATKLAHYRM